MMAFFCGAFGAILVLALLSTGAFLGWKAHEKYSASAAPPQVELPQPTPEQLRQFAEDQEAFSAMLHYSPEMAYGITGDPLKEIGRTEA